MNYFERFLSPSESASAVSELANLGELAIPILESLFNGSAKNKFGTPYRSLPALGCGFVTVKFLGASAKGLEVYVREGIERDHAYAIEAAGYLSEIEEETAHVLARALIRNPASEASASLVRCGYAENAGVIEIIGMDSIAYKTLERIKAYMA
jgi:hypothetical protein